MYNLFYLFKIHHTLYDYALPFYRFQNYFGPVQITLVPLNHCGPVKTVLNRTNNICLRFAPHPKLGRDKKFGDQSKIVLDLQKENALESLKTYHYVLDNFHLGFTKNYEPL